jgi:hypothetical protein
MAASEQEPTTKLNINLLHHYQNNLDLQQAITPERGRKKQKLTRKGRRPTPGSLWEKQKHRIATQKRPTFSTGLLTAHIRRADLLKLAHELKAPQHRLPKLSRRHGRISIPTAPIRRHVL